MAKKIIISFLDQPVTPSVGWTYIIEVNGIPILYNSGIQCLVDFIPNGDIPESVNEIAIGLTLEETISITLNHLRTNFVNPIINYNIVNNTIEVEVNIDSVITINQAYLNVNITITQDIVTVAYPNLKYYINFDDYYLSIKEKGYLGFSTEIYGSISINKGSVDTILESIRGTGLNLALEANSALTFDEFGLADEMTYFVQLKKGNQIVFNGFIKPDGIQQNWVNDEWLVNIAVIDGLGALNDLSFMQSNGTHFTGKLSFYEVIKTCLDRTGSLMTINSSINLEYDGYTGTNMLKDVYVNASRFIKDEKDPVIMNCNEVLTSILNLFSAVVTQENGQWWLYRPNDLVLNQYTTFINQNTNTTFTKNLSAVLGSQIDNYYPHHCDGNQQIEMKGAISAYRLNYEYGFLDGYITNKNLVYDSYMLFDDWIVIRSDKIINDPLYDKGLIMQSLIYSDNSKIQVLKSIVYNVNAGDILKLTFKLSVSRLKQIFYFTVKTATGLYLKQDGTWSSSIEYLSTTCGEWLYGGFSSSIFEITAEVLSSATTFEISIYNPKVFHPLGSTGICKVTYVDIIGIQNQVSGIVGEFHTVSRKNPPSSITKENQKVYNGDGDNSLIGSLYKSDQVTLTSLWHRINKVESYPLLRISAEDDLRIQCNPIKVFSGNILGQIPYLSVVSINNIVGLFMFTQYSYDLKSNKITGKLTQFYNNDLGDIEYLPSYDYGNSTIKPTIKG